jgi:two-component sensor histidine kinase
MQYGIRRAMNVILQGDGSPFGVLEVDSKSEGEFSEQDIAFLQGAANILGMAIEQQQYQRKLQVALDRHQVLLKEVNHRVKNSLQVVSAMLQLQANAAGDQALSEHLNEAASRVNAVGRAYERLAYNADYENIDLIEYLREIIGDLEATVAPCHIQLDAPEAIQFAADRSILVGLIVNELVSNAGKYAYPDGAGGPIQVRAAPQTARQSILISVRDEGVGLPPGFDPETSKRLGTRMVNALSKQLGGEVTRQTAPIGTNFTLVIPLGGSSILKYLGFDLQAALIDAWQLDNREEIAALLEDVDGWERPLAGGLVLQPVARQTGLERTLQIEQSLKGFDESRDHVRTPPCDFAEVSNRYWTFRPPPRQ